MKIAPLDDAFVPIKPKSPPFVKGPFFLCVLLILSAGLFFLGGCAGKQVTEEGRGDSSDLPAISAKTYDVQILRRSRSSRVYLIETIAAPLPPEGRIILLKKNDEPQMAFRVLKQYPDKAQFAAKNVRLYGEIDYLEDQQTFLAIEKISDMAPPPPTEQDQQDMKELETEPPVEEPPTPPVSKMEPAPEPEDLTSDEDEWLALTAEEVQPLDKNSQALAGELGYFRNVKDDGLSIFLPGAGLRYSLSLLKRLFLNRSTAQDSLEVEGGLFFYKILNLGSNADAYSVMPIAGTLRYTVLLGEAFGFFFYGGIQKNLVVSSVQSSKELLEALASILPAAGGGFLFQIGPNWEAKVNLGMDLIGGGIVLRF